MIYLLITTSIDVVSELPEDYNFSDAKELCPETYENNEEEKSINSKQVAWEEQDTGLICRDVSEETSKKLCYVNYVGKGTDKRKNEYLTSIGNTLQIMKKYPQVKIIIVENNGNRNTYLDQFKNDGVDIVYTNSNFITSKTINIPGIVMHKGHKELFDIKEVIQKYNINDNDFLIKLTGRYYMINSSFIDTIVNNLSLDSGGILSKENQIYDAFIKFFNVCTRTFETYDCVLGLACMKVIHWKNLEYIEQISPEIILAKYVRKNCIVKEIIDLGMAFNHFDSYYTSYF